MNEEKKRKSWVDIYKDVSFIRDNHSKLFSTEIASRLNISCIKVVRIAKELNLELLNIERADKVLVREKSIIPKRRYTRKPKRRSIIKKLIAFFKNKIT